MKRLDLEALYADRETVRALLEHLGDEDPIGRMSFGSRLATIDAEIQRLAGAEVTTGSVALMFSGRPVHGSRSIETEFASNALQSFQDLVKKQIAGEEFGRLGTRGKVPERTSSTLVIRELVRGSIGFLLEEYSENEELADTPIKKAIGEVTSIISDAAAESDEQFEHSVETLDPRILVSLRDFFQNLDEGAAAIRIVEDSRDESLDAQAVHRARLRVEATEVRDIESESVIGEILGLLPDSRRFEMKLLDTGELIRGSVAAALAARWLELIELPGEKLVGKVWRTKMRIREIRERNRPPRNLYTLLNLIERRDE